MKNKKWVRFVESFILLPGLTMSGSPVGPISQAVINMANTPSVVFAQKQNTEVAQLAIKDAADKKLEDQKSKALAIDAYFKDKDMPLEGMGMKMVLEAEKNDLDWRLLPAISVRESTGGQHDCQMVPNNAFGWGSCKIGFKSNEEAIETVARNLGGNNPKTARHYDNKTTKQILQAYNPPSVVRYYAEQVMAIMNSIGDADSVMVPIATT